jgi:hypothetical protein
MVITLGDGPFAGSARRSLGIALYRRSKISQMDSSEDRLAGLIYTRDKLAAALCDEPSDRDLPPLAREYRQILREIATIDAQKEEADVIDEIASRRSAKASRRAKRPS